MTLKKLVKIFENQPRSRCANYDTYQKNDPNVAHFQPIETLIKLPLTSSNYTSVVIG